MKKIKILPVIIFAFVLQNIAAQDLIVTSKGDSLNCKITAQKAKQIYFSYVNKGAVRRTLMNNSDVSQLKFDYFSQVEVPKHLVEAPQQFKKFRVAVDAGMAYRYAPIIDGLDPIAESHMKKLKWGTSLEGEVAFFFKESLGVGLMYSCFSAKHTTSNIVAYNNGTTIGSGEMSDETKIWFLGPSFNARFYNMNYSACWYLGASIGYMHYTDKAFFVGDRYTYTGETVGVALSGGYDWNLTEVLGMGIKLSLIGGSLSEYKVDDGFYEETIDFEDDEYENLSRIQLSIGFRLNL